MPHVWCVEMLFDGKYLPIATESWLTRTVARKRLKWWKK